MTNKEIYERLLNAARTDRENWHKCNRLTEFEQESEYYAIYEGICRAAMYLLPTEMYFKWKTESQSLGGKT